MMRFLKLCVILIFDVVRDDHFTVAVQKRCESAGTAAFMPEIIDTGIGIDPDLCNIEGALRIYADESFVFFHFLLLMACIETA